MPAPPIHDTLPPVARLCASCGDLVEVPELDALGRPSALCPECKAPEPRDLEREDRDLVAREDAHEPRRDSSDGREDL